MTTAADTNILLDLLIPGAAGAAAAQRALDDSASRGDVIICEAVYAELATVFTSHDDLRAFFTTTGVRLVPSGEVALWQAGQAWDRYRQRRPTHLECPHCGTPNRVACTGCGSSLTPRQHVVADFIIGAHAQHHADAPLTRDRGYYRTYFPGLTLLHP